MKLILHIGTEKTGTTTLQYFLDKNRKKLKSKGFYVLNSGGQRNQQAVACYCMNENRDDDFFKNAKIYSLEARQSFKKKLLKKFNRELDALSSKIHTVIISSEHFHSRLTSHEEISNLKQLIGSRFNEVQILCYLREQASLAESAYSTSIRAGSSISLADFFKYCTPNDIYYNHFLSLSCWAEVFGKSSVSPRIFDRSSLIEGDLIKDFLTIVDKRLIKSDFKMAEDKNHAIGNLGKVIARSFNLVSPKYDKHGRINKENRRIREKIFDTFDGKGTILSKERYDQIYDTFSQANRELARIYFDHSKNPFPYKPPSDSSFELKDEYSDVLADLIRKLKRCSYFSDRDADVLRDAAILLENQNVQISYQLMTMAHKLRPLGPYISKKLDQYRESCKLEQNQK